MLLFTTVAFYSQKNSKIRLTYEVGMKGHKLDSSLTKGQKKYNDFAKNVAKKMYFLDINNEQSIFYINKKMKIETNNKLDLVSAFVGSGIYYHNTKLNKTLNQKNALGEDFIIENKVKYNWKLSQEKRKIADYICFKATTIQKFINRIGETRTKQITAWYYPNLPINVGIKEYHGLPGVIIYLEEGSIYYKCIKIEINVKEKLTITKPKKGKIISEKEYNDILKNDFGKKFGLKNR